MVRMPKPVNQYPKKCKLTLPEPSMFSMQIKKKLKNQRVKVNNYHSYTLVVTAKSKYFKFHGQSETNQLAYK